MPWAGPRYRSDLADECGRGQNSLRRRLEALGWSRLALPSSDDQSGTIAHQRAVVEIQGRTALSCPPTGARPQPRPADKNDVVRPTNPELWKETGLTVSMVTHDLSEGFRLGIRLLVSTRSAMPLRSAGLWGADYL